MATAWLEEHTLETAFLNSVVWYYQELARRIGAEHMQTYLDAFKYGNGDMSGAIDRFWLTGALRVSADAQVDFLQRFYFDELGLSPATTKTAKDLFVLEETPEYRLSGKTGWAGFGDPATPGLGWFVGYVERDGEVYFFALNLDMEHADSADARLSITKDILRHVGAMPEA
ncbi:penicillin-binding transpeptidase domain-containing protein [Alkalilimnicola ehrlichii]|uniref:penicillin-binding transpeptidase domain-containing protein n=1 Tax=Alkalilimnicola ehrlichii TaxID=351052 RepID=UPI0021635F97|nr:penicillin-binding transpeptidase domain-containing protein [Alkalilimnicola ehrlichii]